MRSNVRSYTYDDLDRLTEADNVPGAGGGYTNFYYQYDSIGNMTYKSDCGVMSYGVGAGPHAVTSAGGYSYSYDLNGNMLSGKAKTMQYDVENRLVQVNDSGVVSSYVYDGDGGRVKQTAGSLTTTYIGSLYEVDSTGKITKHIFAGSNRVVTRDSTGAVYYYHSDHLGSSSIITNASGAQVQHIEYTPYGSIAVNEGTDAAKFKFTGKELDKSGLYFYGARYYNPELGRFITADTIVQAPYDPQSLNRYSYCRNNPLNYIDPTGHWFWAAVILIAKIAAAVSATAAVAGAISYASGNESLARSFFQIAQYSGYISAAAGASAFVNAAFQAGRSQAVNIASLLNFAADENSTVDLGTIVVTPNRSMAATWAWEATKDAVEAGTVGAISAVGSGVAVTGMFIGNIVNSAMTPISNFIVDKEINGFSICARYGNWGGLDWSGGQQISAGGIGGSAVLATDQMDGYFKQHDFNVYNALKVASPSARKAFVREANRILYGQLKSLAEDPSDWQQPAKNPNEARAYRRKAERWFNPNNLFQ